MKRQKIYIILLIQLFALELTSAQDTIILPINKVFYDGEYKVASMTEEISSYSKYPRSINTDGSIRIVNANDWTSGFFPGSLWYMFENTGNAKYGTDAKSWTDPIESQKNNTGTHDLGFMLYCSFGNGLRLSNINNYDNILVTAANSLMTRYNPTVGCTESWDFGSWDFPVIIDNMMNLELLFWASKHTGDSKYYDAAIDHANTTIQNHFRTDNSTYHVINYKEADGTVISKETHQGYNDESDWARGQAWGLYGYTMCYRETNNPAFLAQAEKIADFYINHANLPKDLIPYWDFKDPKIATDSDNVPRDVSAATITASALIELSKYSTKGAEYIVFATKSLNNLTQPKYTTDPNSSNNFILLKSTGSKPSNSEVSTSINYGDYYYLEALTRYKTVMGTDFEPYTVYSDSSIMDINTTVIDSVIIYDIDNVGGYTVDLESNPSFVTLQKLSNSSYIITAKPTESNPGIHNFEISIVYNDGSSIIKPIVYNVKIPSVINTQINGNTDIKMYTNETQLIISGEECKNVKQISIYNTSGSLIHKQNTILGSNRIIIPHNNLKTGIYIYKIATASQAYTAKFIKQ